MSIGRTVGMLMLVQAIGGILANFVLLDPATAHPGFLVNAAPHALSLGASALLGIFIGAFALAIAITVFPLFKKYSERMALAFLALAAAALALAVVENGTVMSMLSLSKAYAAANAADPGAFEGLRGVVAASRNWAHFTHLIVGGSIFLLFYATLFRFTLVPRALAALGIAAFVVQMINVSLPFFGGQVIFPLLAPAGLVNFALVAWLLTKGFSDEAAATA